MAKYLLLKHYRGAPEATNGVPMDQWTPDEVEAHIRYMNDFAARLEQSAKPPRIAAARRSWALPPRLTQTGVRYRICQGQTCATLVSIAPQGRSLRAVSIR